MEFKTKINYRSKIKIGLEPSGKIKVWWFFIRLELLLFPTTYKFIENKKDPSGEI